MAAINFFFRKCNDLIPLIRLQPINFDTKDCMWRFTPRQMQSSTVIGGYESGYEILKLGCNDGMKKWSFDAGAGQNEISDWRETFDD